MVCIRHGKILNVRFFFLLVTFKLIIPLPERTNTYLCIVSVD